MWFGVGVAGGCPSPYRLIAFPSPHSVHSHLILLLFLPLPLLHTTSTPTPLLMAYQFFAKGQNHLQAQTPSIPSSSRPSNSVPPIHPPPPQPPKSATVATTRPPTKEETFIPYPDITPVGYKTPHPNATIEPIGVAHIPSLTRITGLLLPIRYPNSFYTATITDPVIASLSRVAIYHDQPGSDKVIGGIRCRLERLDTPNTLEEERGREHEQGTNLYIQTLHLLSPYRGHGVAAALLNSLLFETPPSSKNTQYRVSKLVKHYSIRSVTAHVHEANEDGLRWYTARGFKVQDGVVEGYYRRLKPSGARIVKLDVEWLENDQVKEAPANGEEDDEEGWEKIEAHDSEEEGDHGVQLLPESQSQPQSQPRSFEDATTPSRKRKAEEEKGNIPQRR